MAALDDSAGSPPGDVCLAVSCADVYEWASLWALLVYSVPSCDACGGEVALGDSDCSAGRAGEAGGDAASGAACADSVYDVAEDLDRASAGGPALP